jgi:DNA polymerase III delta prime subunit
VGFFGKMLLKYDTVGNEAMRIRLEKEALAGALPHALLITGPSGIGKFRLALKLASTLLQNDPRVERRMHPACVIVDELWVEGENENMETLGASSNFDQSHRKKDKKKTDAIGKDDLLVFIEFLFQTTDYPWKVCVVRDIERMTNETANVFLKTLEEPPPKTMFLLTSSAPSRLLPTILSRVQREQMAIVSDDVLVCFAKDHGISQAQACEMAVLAEGRSERMREFLDNETVFFEKKSLFEQIKSFFSLGMLDKFSWAEEWSKLPAKELFERITMLEALIRQKYRQKLANQGLCEKEGKMLVEIARAKEDIAKNANKRLALEVLFLEMES